MIPFMLILLPTSVIAEPQKDKITEHLYNNVLIYESKELPPFPVGEYRKEEIPIIKPKIESGVVQQSIIKWADFYGLDSTYMLNIAECESTFRPDANNGSHFGVFQFAPSTFNANVKYMAKAGIIIDNADVWNYEHNIQVASWMFANFQSWQWECK